LRGGGPARIIPRRMFIGHLAVGFASKRVAPRASLGVLMTAPLLLDLLWPLFLTLGIEQVRMIPGVRGFLTLDFVSYPWSHSLLMAGVWGVLFAALYRTRSAYALGAIVIALGVVSHWVLDWVVHVPDLPLAPGVPVRLGLGLWRNPPLTIAIESVMFVAGLGSYLATTRARNLAGHIGLWLFVALMLFLYFSQVNAPAPPGLRALEIVGIATWIFVPWMFWVDRNRELRRPAT
jgi:hypothetical protein